MNNILADNSFLDDFNPGQLSRLIAQKAKQLRLSRNMSQQELAERSGVSLGSIKRFEQKGEIALMSLLKIAVVMDAVEDFKRLFSQDTYQSINEVIDSVKPKKQRAGKKKS